MTRNLIGIARAPSARQNSPSYLTRTVHLSLKSQPLHKFAACAIRAMKNDENPPEG